MVTRIRKLLEDKQLTPTQFADFIGVGRPVMSHILSERNKPSLEVVQRIISAFPELSLPWLLSGVGEMLAAADAAAAPTNLPGSPELGESAAALPQAAAAAAPVAAEPVEPAPVDAPGELVRAPAMAVKAAGALAPLAVPPVSTLVAAVPTPAHESAQDTAGPALAPTPTLPEIKPFRAARFTPKAAVAPEVSVSAPASPVMPSTPVPPMAPGIAPAQALVPASTVPAEAMLPFLSEPGKAIRRIVIFYRDGSFADYQPEQ